MYLFINFLLFFFFFTYYYYARITCHPGCRLGVRQPRTCWLIKIPKDITAQLITIFVGEELKVDQPKGKEEGAAQATVLTKKSTKCPGLSELTIPSTMFSSDDT